MLAAHRVEPSLSADLLYQFPHRPKHVFIIKKSGSAIVDKKAATLAEWLKSEHKLIVYVETVVFETQRDLFPYCVPYSANHHRHVVELVVTLGGDGTALHANSLFNDSHTIPMMLSFAMGTLGFLTPFDYNDYEAIITQLLSAHRTSRRNNAAADSGGGGGGEVCHGAQSMVAVQSKCEPQTRMGRRDSTDSSDGSDYVISLCPRMRLLCHVWKKPKRMPVASPEERAKRAQEKRDAAKKRFGNSVDNSDIDSDTSEEDDDDDTITNTNNIDFTTTETEHKVDDDHGPDSDLSNALTEKARFAQVEIAQAHIERQRSIERRIVECANIIAERKSSHISHKISDNDNVSDGENSQKKDAPNGVISQTQLTNNMDDSRHNEVYLGATFHPLNELLLSSATSRNLTSIDLSLIQENGKIVKVSTVLADALIISTATGSTAYSMSAGGPMVSPNTHCIIVTPVCPHSLSFRPLILPDSTHLLLSLSASSRSEVGLIVCDGSKERRLRKGEWVTIRQDSVPMWSVNWIGKRETHHSQQTPSCTSCSTDEVDSSVLWFRSISSKLNWNTRESHHDHDSELNDESFRLRC